MNVNEIISESEYADIIITLLQPPYSISSITKLIFISFCAKNESNTAKYSNRKRNFVDVFISNISIKLSTHRNEINQIIRVIHMLDKANKVSIDGDDITPIYNFSFNTENNFLSYCNGKNPNPIKEINKLDPKALVEEVLRYV